MKKCGYNDKLKFETAEQKTEMNNKTIEYEIQFSIIFYLAVQLK